MRLTIGSIVAVNEHGASMMKALAENHLSDWEYIPAGSCGKIQSINNMDLYLIYFAQFDSIVWLDSDSVDEVLS